MPVEFEKYGFKDNEDMPGFFTFEDYRELGVGLSYDTDTNLIKVYAGEGPEYLIGRMPASNQSLALLLKTFGIKR